MKTTITFSKEDYLKKYIRSSCFSEKVIRKTYESLYDNLIFTIFACDFASSTHCDLRFVVTGIQKIITRIYEDVEKKHPELFP